MEAFHAGEATTLVATDIAARGIHVDDVALVVHADPPVEHKAYLHRSGRTARAGAEGTVITLMTDEQLRDVRDLTRLAGIKPTTTKINGPGHPMLVELAPGERSLVPGGLVVEAPTGAGADGVPCGAGGGARNRSRSRQRWRRSPAARARASGPRARAASGRRRARRRPAAPRAVRARRAASRAAASAVAAARAPRAVSPASAAAVATAPRRSAAVADPSPIQHRTGP